ncbi:MAG TPA: hypothetical protein O0Y08_03425 [Methanocorpusculum sp.]|nr:hypothetical protein [Methanocorpusculum sp.]HJJ45361.1 hypothetical protein [Methanocorpusculum sp.]HJJ59896.1 hypothetical protein [Methanocorpusculum sp.]
MNTRMQFLEHELALNEREQQKKSSVQTSIPTPDSAASPAASEQIVKLEHKVHELEAMVNGLTEELLDLKTITRKLSATIEKLGGNQQQTVSQVPQRTAVRRPVPEQPKADTPSPAAVRPAPQAPTPAQTQEKRSFSAPGTPMPPRERQEYAHVQQPSSHSYAVMPEAKPAPAEVPAEAEAPLKPGEYEFVMQPDGTILKRPKKTQGSVIIAGTGYGKGHLSRSSAIRAESDAVIEAVEDDTVEIK